MPDRSLLSPEVVGARIHDRSRRRHLLMAAAAAAVGGAVGSGLVVAGALGLSSGLECAAPVPHLSSTPPAPAVDISPAPLPEVSTSPAPIAPAPVPAAPNAPGRAASILQADTPRLVIDADAASEWLTPAPAKVVEVDDIHFILERSVDVDALPDDLRALSGESVTFFDKSGASCRARVGSLSAVRVVYDDYDNPSAGGEAMDAWDWGQPTLVATIDDIPADCEVAMGGAVIGEGAFVPARVSALGSSNLSNHALAAWRASAAWRSTQSAFRGESGEGVWEQDIKPSMHLIGDLESGVIVVNLDVGSCGDFEGSVTAAFHVENGNLGAPIAIPHDRIISSILAAADTNGDDIPELFIHNHNFSTDTLQTTPAGYKLHEGPDATITFCRC